MRRLALLAVVGLLSVSSVQHTVNILCPRRRHGRCSENHVHMFIVMDSQCLRRSRPVHLAVTVVGNYLLALTKKDVSTVLWVETICIPRAERCGPPGGARLSR